MPNLANYTKMRLSDVELGDNVLWDYKDNYGSKKKVFATVVGLTPGARRFLSRTIHVMVSGPDRATLVDDRAGSSMIWVQNRAPEL